MKTLELRPEGPEFTVGTETAKEQPWRALVEMVANAPPVQPNGQSAGFTPELILKRLRISEPLAALPVDATAFEMEDSDAKELAQALKGVRFQRASRWISDFCEAVKALAKD